MKMVMESFTSAHTGSDGVSVGSVQLEDGADWLVGGESERDHFCRHALLTQSGRDLPCGDVRPIVVVADLCAAPNKNETESLSEN